MTDIAYTTLSTATTVGTGNATDGTGNFDNLMKVVTLHLEDQFTAGRITGTDYATVYLGALQSTLAQAVSFTLGMNRANADVNLVDKQILSETAKELQIDAQTALLGQQKLTEVQQTSKLSYEVSDIQPEQKTLIQEQIDLLEQQFSTEVNQTSKVLAEKNLTEQQDAVGVKQALKIAAEEALLIQKKYTEFAQTGNTSNTVAADSSVIGKQNLLFVEQAKGFKWNADAKYLKSILDAYAINVSVSKSDDTATTALLGGYQADVTDAPSANPPVDGNRDRIGDIIGKLQPKIAATADAAGDVDTVG